MSGLKPAAMCLALVLVSACQDVPSENTQVSDTSVNVLPSWRPGSTRNAIVEFVDRVTTSGSAEFVPVPERIAVFDNDGTLWAERPIYFQLLFAMDRVRALEADHPDWQSTQPFKGVLDGDLEAVAATGVAGLLELTMATHSGMTTAEFESIASEWISNARHPQLNRPFTELVYQPMLELLDYLRANGFKTYIVSGGGIEFMRPWTEEIYGIPPEQVMGSMIKLSFEYRDGIPVILRQPEIDFVDDKSGKPIGIHRFIGRRPIAAFGNSDGDLQMLQWTVAGPGARLAAIVHHTDAEREWAYDRESHVGRLDAALDEAERNGWVIVDMQRDWEEIFPAAGE